MDPQRFLAQLERDIREQNETIAKARQLLQSCDPEVLIVVDLDEMPTPSLRDVGDVPLGAVRV
jgi:hypothetical protein